MNFINKQYKLVLVCIPLLSFALHFHIFSMDLLGIHVWRQTETQTVINNFYKADMNILNPRVNDHPDMSQLHRMEFPLMQWLFAVFYKIFGPHIVISRILSFIIGLFSVWGMFYLCDNVFKNKAVASLCAWCFNFSPVFYYYTVNPMPDNIALCFGIWAIGFFYRYITSGKISYVIWSAVCLCLSALTKLPFILYGSFMITFLVVQFKKENTVRELKAVFIIYAVLIIPAISWYVTVIPTWNNVVVKGAFGMQQSLNEWLYLFWGHITSLLPELLINYGSVLFFITGFYFMFKKRLYRNNEFPLFLSWGISIILYFLYELNVIGTVHDYYLFPFLPLIFLIVGLGIAHLLAIKKNRYNMLCIFCICVLPLTAFLRIDSRWDTRAPGFDPAFLKYERELRNLIPQNVYCIVGNDGSPYILLYYIDRKGWAFDQDYLTSEQFSYYIRSGAKYLFSNTRIEDRPDIKIHLDEKIFDKENLRVYKLK